MCSAITYFISVAGPEDYSFGYRPLPSPGSEAVLQRHRPHAVGLSASGRLILGPSTRDLGHDGIRCKATVPVSWIRIPSRATLCVIHNCFFRFSN